MSVIRRQSIHHSIVNYVGVLIGTLSTLFVYPLAREAYGLARFLIDTSVFLYPFIMLGFESVTIRFFPEFRNPDRGHHGFLSLMLLPVMIGCVVFCLFSWLWGWDLLGWLESNAGMNFTAEPLLSRFVPLVVPATCMISLGWIFNQYCANFHHVTVPAILQNFIKVSLPLLILSFLAGDIGIDIMAYGVVANYGIVLLLYMLYVRYIGEWRLRTDWSFLNRDLAGRMGTYAFFSLFGSLGTLIAFRIDSIMVSTMVGLENNGDFGITSTIAQTIAIPTNAVIAIAAPILSAAWAERDLGRIRTVYRKASTNLLIPGLLIYTGMWLCLDLLFQLMPNGSAIEQGKWIILILGFAKVVDMATSVNNEVIAYSRYFRFNFYAVIVLAVLNIVLNFILIHRYGIIGAAIATALSILIYNLLKFLFIWIRFRMQPFSIATVKLVVISVASYALICWWPLTGKPLLDLLIRCVAIAIVFLSGVWFWKVSEDVQELYLRLREKLMPKSK